MPNWPPSFKVVESVELIANNVETVEVTCVHWWNNWDCKNSL